MATEKQIRARNKQQRDAFINGATLNGQYGFKVFINEMNDWLDNGDWRGMHDLLKRSAPADARQFRKLLALVTEDTTWTYSAKSGFKRDKEAEKKMSNVSHLNERGLNKRGVFDLWAMYHTGVSFRSYDKVKAEDTRDEAEKSAARKADLAAKTLRLLDKEGMSIDEWAHFLRVCKVKEDAKGNAA